MVGALTGCNGTTGGGNQEPQQVQQQVTLTPFETCSDLEQYIEDNYVKQMDEIIEQQRTGGYGWFGRGGVEDAAGGTPPQASNGGSKTTAPTSYTQTNTQVKGVDEADFMKNDGTRIFTLSGSTLYATQSWPPQDIKSKGSLAIEGWPQSMFLDENNRITVLSSVWLTDPTANDGKTAGDADYCYYCYSGTQATKITVVDVTDMAAMKVTSELYYPGYMADTRRIGSSVRIVIGDYFNWPEGVSYWPPYDANHPDGYNDKVWFNAQLDILKSKNEAAIRSQTLDFWLKKGKRKAQDGSLIDVGYSCGDFTQMNAPTKLTGLLNIITVNLDKLDQGTGHRVTLLGDLGTVYASAKSLYVAEWHWWWGWWWNGQQDAAYIHKFDITNPDKAVYQASGPITGHIRDQFSLDEHNDNLRVAHTIQTWKDDPASDDQWAGTWETTNRVTVLGQDGAALNVRGTTPELAKGETIQSARFLGDKGYVVTFRQVDPLFTIDLSDASSPKVVGELKVPGFSTYIHPLDDNHLLTIGVYQPEQTDPNQPVNWEERRQQLTIFDVTDFANPVQKFTLTSGTAYGWSEAQWDHKAFNYFPERGLLAVPFSDYKTTGCGGSTDPNCWDTYWNSFISEVRVFKIDTKTGIEFKGALSMADIYKSYGYADWTYYYSPWIRRSVMASDADGKDFVYAISDAGVRVANLQTLETLGTAEFDPSTTTSPGTGTGTGTSGGTSDSSGGGGK